jgi:hypothetical protein
MARLFVAYEQQGETSGYQGLGKTLLDYQRAEEEQKLAQQEMQRRLAKDEQERAYQEASLELQQGEVKERRRANRAAERQRETALEASRADSQADRDLRIELAERAEKGAGQRAELAADTQVETTRLREEGATARATAGREERQAQEAKEVGVNKANLKTNMRGWLERTTEGVEALDVADRPNAAALKQRTEQFRSLAERIDAATSPEEIAMLTEEWKQLRISSDKMIEDRAEEVANSKAQKAYDTAVSRASTPIEEGGAGYTDEEVQSMLTGDLAQDTRTVQRAVRDRTRYLFAADALQEAKRTNSDWWETNIGEDGEKIEEDSFLDDMWKQSQQGTEREKAEALEVLGRMVRLGSSAPQSQAVIRDMENNRRRREATLQQQLDRQSFATKLGASQLPTMLDMGDRLDYMSENAEELGLDPETVAQIDTMSEILTGVFRDYKRPEDDSAMRRRQWSERQQKLDASPDMEVADRLRKAVDEGDLSIEQVQGILKWMTQDIYKVQGDASFESWMGEEETKREPVQRSGQMM